SINRFVEGQPSRFTQNRGNSFLERPNEHYEFFIQDDWRPLRDLTLNLGLRYDYESARTEALKEVTGSPGPGISRDKNNWAPRLGFAWTPGRSLKQVVYGGTGVYYDQIVLNIIGTARFTPPRIIGIRIDNPGWPDPLAGGGTIHPSGVSVIDVDLKTPYSWSSQVGYRRELTKDLGLDVSFVYKREENQVAVLNTNAGLPGTADIFGAHPERPDPTVGVRRFFTNLGFVRYKGLLVYLNKRFSHNMQGSLAYTLSSTVDNTSSFNDSIDVPSNPRLSNGPASHDRRHRIRGNMKWVLPWKTELGAIVEYLSEEPLNIVAGGRDLDGDGSTGDWVNEALCLNVSCPGFSYSRNSVRKLSTEEANRLRALFGLPPIAEYGNNPKLFNIDLTLQRRFRVGARRLRIAAHGFNVLNVPQRDQPAQNILSSNFGRHLSVSQPRAIQFIFQYEF
ncbi:MAG: TonB-dependent receptor domain-containing protein, partial [Acidimicrobiia bacterium]